MDVEKGLSSSPKRLSPVYFYDERGSKLFEKICDLEEYYLTRKETEILNRYAPQIIASLPHNTHLVELGSGSSTKTRIILEAALAKFTTTRYSPIDISEELLRETTMQLNQQYPELIIEAVADRYEVGLERLLRNDESPDCVMWLGSSIGNLTREEACEFLRNVCQAFGPEDSLLLGIDLRKRVDIIEPAYNDSKGITAEFNLNLLHRINQDLGGEFDVETFSHHAFFDESEGRIEMYLMSQIDQEVWVDSVNKSFHFARDERILTEYSYRYSHAEIETLAKHSGFRLEKQWLDEAGWFSLNQFVTID